MPSPSPLLEWCIVRLGEDLNWWVDEISDDVHWDVDGLSIIDPRQMSHLIELCEPLREYGFNFDVLDNAFFTFRIDRELQDGRIRVLRSRDSLSESEDRLFALPDILDEEKGPYADFLDQITKVRVKMLNDLIDFEQKLTIDELEEEIRDRQNTDFIEGRATHFFQEISAILEYVPVGFELDEDDDVDGGEDEEIADLPDFDEAEEKIEEDETMRWDEEEKEEDEEEESEEAHAPPVGETEDWGSDDEDDEDEKPKSKAAAKPGAKPAPKPAAKPAPKPAAKPATKAASPKAPAKVAAKAKSAPGRATTASKGRGKSR